MAIINKEGLNACDDSERKLRQCKNLVYSPHDVGECTHNEDLYLNCYEKGEYISPPCSLANPKNCENGVMLLTPWSLETNQGLVVVHYNG